MLQAALLLIFPALMAYAAASDLVTMRISNKVSLTLVVAFAVFAAAGGLPLASLAMHVGAGLTMLSICFAMFSFGWIGGGDAKLAAATALWLGFGPALVDYLFIATVAGGALTLAIMSLRGTLLPAFAMQWTWLSRLHDDKSGVPYGIALAGAALVVYPHSPIWTAILNA